MYLFVEQKWTFRLLCECKFFGSREVLRTLYYGSLKVFMGGFINVLRTEIIGYLKVIFNNILRTFSKCCESVMKTLNKHLRTKCKGYLEFLNNFLKLSQNVWIRLNNTSILFWVKTFLTPTTDTEGHMDMNLLRH